MSRIACFQPVTDGQDECYGTNWQPTARAPYLRQHGSALVIELPRRSRGAVYVNGLPVIGGLQVVRPGDVVRVVRRGRPDVSYVVGGLLPAREPGRGRLCQFTGLAIREEAVRCPCGRLYGAAVAEQIRVCPQCQASLLGEVSAPPEEML